MISYLSMLGLKFTHINKRAKVHTVSGDGATNGIYIRIFPTNSQATQSPVLLEQSDTVGRISANDNAAFTEGCARIG